MKLIGITGGIGSGKSSIADVLKVKGIPVYNADNESKRLISSDPLLIQQLKNLLGDDIYFEDGSLNKKRMADIIFNNPTLLAQTNNIIHPAVGRDFLQWASRQKSPLVAIESALLFQSQMNIHIDYILVVDAPLETRIRRVILRDNTTREKAEARIDKQMDSQKMRLLADFVIENDDNDAVLPQIAAFLSSLLSPTHF